MRYVLLLQAERVSAFAIGRREFGVAIVFNNNSTDREKFVQYLSERQHSLFSIVLDSRDEEHHQETLPVLKRRDHQLVLKKMSARYFPDQSLSVIAIDNSERTTDNKCLATVSGVVSSNDCRVWLDLLDANSTLMTDISSLSLLGLAMHQVTDSAVSLCAVQLGQNDFRLMAYQNTRLIISRHLSVSENIADELMGELQQTKNYLDRLPPIAGSRKQKPMSSSSVKKSISKAPQPETRVQIIGALSADSRAVLEDAGISVTGCRAMAGMLGIKSEITVPYADALFVALAVKRKSKYAKYSMGDYKNHFFARRLRHVLFAGTIVCLSVTAAATAAAVHYNETWSSLINTTMLLSSEGDNTDTLNVESPIESDFTIDAIRDSMRIADYMSAKGQYTPLHFLSSLATNLTLFPELEVTSIQWSRLDPVYSGDISELARLAAKSDVGGIEAAVYYSATVTGNIRMESAERAESLSRFNSFISTVEAADRYSSVAVIDAPFGLAQREYSSGENLPAEREKFVIELAVREMVR